MSSTVLVGYVSRYGSTREVAEAVASTLRESGLAVDMQPLREVGSLAEYSAVVLGAPLFMFRWHKDALSFLARHHKALMERPVAVFALGPVHDPHDEKEWQDSHAQLGKELGKSPGSNRSPSKCSAASTTRPVYDSRSICLPARRRQLTCATGRRCAPGHQPWGESLSLLCGNRNELRKGSRAALRSPPERTRMRPNAPECARMRPNANVNHL